MKNIRKIALALLTTVGLATVSSCADGFEEMNTNPNEISRALPETLIAPAITDVVKRNLNRAMRLSNELMQVHVSRNDGDQIHRYVIRASEADYMWNNWYLQLTNFRDIYTNAESNPTAQSNTFMGISRICEVWVASMLTDTYGDVPYAEASKGREGVLQPGFDKQEDIYVDLFLKLEEANTLLKSNQNLTTNQAQIEPIYGGVAASWRKFGNSLYLRLLMRVSGRSETIAAGKTAPEKIREIVDERPADYPVFQKNEESAILRFTGTAPFQSEFQLWREADFTVSQDLADFFVSNLVEWGDPRIAKWATLSDGAYQGIQSGYAVGKVPADGSGYNKILMTEPLLGNMMNYPELQFILAEAAAKGWISGSAKAYYDSGVTSAITLWGLEVPASYLSSPAIAFEDDYTLDTQMEKIHLQKYYTLFFTDFQQWFEYRRTGYPTLPKGPGLQNNGEMPARFNYPVYVQSLNRDNYQSAVAGQGPDNISTKVWWQQN